MAFVAGDFQAGAVYNSGTATWSVAMPASVQAGDWLYLCITSNTDHTVSSINGSAATGTPLVADGWTEIVHATSAQDGFSIWEKKHDGSEADPCVVVMSGAEIGVAHIFRVRNAAGTTPRGQLASVTSSTTTSAVTPPANDHAIVAVVHIDPASATSWTWSAASEIFDSSDGANASMAAAYIIQTTAASQAIAYTPSPSATVGWTRWEMEPGASGTTHTGSASLAITVAIATAGTATHLASVTTPITFGAATAGAKTTFGTAALPIAVTVATNGTRTTTSSASLPVSFNAATSGVRATTGSASLPMVLSIFSAGTSTNGGTATLTLTLGIATAGTVVKRGRVDLPLTPDVTSTCTKSTTGSAALPITFSTTSTAIVGAFNSASLPILFDAFVAGDRPGAAPLPEIGAGTIAESGAGAIGRGGYGRIAPPTTGGI